jgi:paraquat-inducible protein B
LPVLLAVDVIDPSVNEIGSVGVVENLAFARGLKALAVETAIEYGKVLILYRNTVMWEVTPSFRVQSGNYFILKCRRG